MGDTIDVSSDTCYAVSASALAFQVRRSDNAQLIFLSAADNDAELYKVTLGTRGNTTCHIQGRGNTVMGEQLTPGILSEDEWREFWVKWSRGRIQVGRARETVPFMEVQAVNARQIKFVVPAVCVTHFRSQWKFHLGPVRPKSSPRVVPGGELTWVPANQELPQGAIIGGHENEPLHIIRAPHNGSLAPGKYVRSQKMAYIAWGRYAHNKREFEALVGHNFEWVATSGNNIPDGAFPGGYAEYTHETLYIGRAKVDGHLIVGKVQPSYRLIYLPYQGKEIEKSEYEILVVPPVKDPHGVRFKGTKMQHVPIGPGAFIGNRQYIGPPFHFGVQPEYGLYGQRQRPLNGHAHAMFGAAHPCAQPVRGGSLAQPGGFGGSVAQQAGIGGAMAQQVDIGGAIAQPVGFGGSVAQPADFSGHQPGPVAPSSSGGTPLFGSVAQPNSFGAQQSGSLQSSIFGVRSRGSVAQPANFGAQQSGSLAQPNNFGAQQTGSVAQSSVFGAQQPVSIEQPNNFGAQQTGTVAQSSVFGAQPVGSVAQPVNLGAQQFGSVGQSPRFGAQPFGYVVQPVGFGAPQSGSVARPGSFGSQQSVPISQAFFRVPQPNKATPSFGAQQSGFDSQSLFSAQQPNKSTSFGDQQTNFNGQTSVNEQQVNFGIEQSSVQQQQQPSLNDQGFNFGVQRPNAGVQQPNVEEPQPSISGQQFNFGMQQINAGVQQPNVEEPQRSVSGQQFNFGIQQTNTGVQRLNVEEPRPSISGQQFNFGIQQTNAGVQPPNVEEQHPNVDGLQPSTSGQ